MSNSEYTTNENPHIPLPPSSLDDLPYRCVWRYVAGARDEPDKIPFNPRTGREAKSNDPRTFGTRAEVERALATGRYNGQGVLVAEELGITMIDIDDVIPEDRAFDETAIPPRVRRIMRMSNSPWWWTPSGRGQRSFIAATTGQTYKNKTVEGNWVTAEQYTRLRFATVMPERQIAGTPNTFNSNRDDLVAVLEALGFQEREADQPAALSPTYTGGTHSNEEIITAAEKVYGEKFRRLMAGDISGYQESQSDKGRGNEADLAFVSWLCGFTTDDAQVADIWRQALPRKKLDRADYVNRTIAKARGGQRWWFEWERPKDRPVARMASAESPPPPIGEMSCDLQLAEARKEITALKRDRDTLIALLLNPHVSSAEKMALAATIDRAIRKPAEADGYVTIKPGEIANDWRPKPEPGQNTPALNRDGSKPRMNRGSVRKTMVKLTSYGFEARPIREEVPTKNGREPYKETVWKIRPKRIAEFIAPVAAYQPETIVPRQARTIAPQCLECGVDLDVQTWTVTEMTCPDCGQVHREKSEPRKVHPVVVLDDRRPKDKFSTVRSVSNPTTDNFSPGPPPYETTYPMSMAGGVP